MGTRELPIYGTVNRRRRQIIGHTLVDDEFFDYVNQWHWNVTKAGYIMRTYSIVPGRGGKRGCIYLHRLIAGIGPDEQVDHINRDTRDNRRANLRCSNNKLNRQNLPSYAGSMSRYRGVTWDVDRKKWQAKAQLDGRTYHMGRFVVELDAAIAAARWRKEHMPHTVEELV